MAVWLATKTLDAINKAICADEGATFRKYQGQVLPHMADAYSEEQDAHRSHLGASVIGGACDRAIYYGHRWAVKRSPRGKAREDAVSAESRMRRLWNRGHLEEGRFIAMLLSAGIQVYQQDETGKQIRISNLGGHFSGSLDAVLKMLPDLPADVPALGEFKTHSDDSFDKLLADGVRISKPEHYVQMQEYMHHKELLYGLYLAINKNTEALYGEIVQYDRGTAERFLDRARAIIFAEDAPERIRGASPGFFVCRYMCDFKEVCYNTIKPLVNCRTCQYIKPLEEGGWVCRQTGALLDKQDQEAGCGQYKQAKGMK